MREIILTEEILKKSAEFSNFCQKFKMEWWEKSDQYIPENQLDELAIIAFKLIK